MYLQITAKCRISKYTVYNFLLGIKIKIKMLIELNFTASYKHIFMKKFIEKEKIIIMHKKSLVSTNKWSIKTISFFNAVNCNYKNVVIETFGSC